MLTAVPVMDALALLARLRSETRAEHDAIERALDLTAGVTRARYRAVLERMHGYYGPLEERLRDVPGVDLERRRKLPLLAADLAALGGGTAGLPRCAALPALERAAERVGCLYVIEGATLGGLVLTRILRDTLSITPSTGGSFFCGYGEATGAMWREVCAAITAFGTRAPDTHDTVVASAAATFRTLRAWCEETA